MLKDISVIIPIHNESKNVERLYLKLKKVLEPLKKDYELVFVDDGSRDNTFQHLCEIYNNDKDVNIIRLTKNFGQTSGLAAGFDFARGEIIITMDGDLQHDPEDIPRFLEKIYLGYDLVNGWKKKRADNIFTKKIPSLIANRLIGLLFNLNLHDACSTFKAYRKGIVKDIELYGELHRFIPLLIKKKVISICEIEINCNKRLYGKTHYGLGRIKRVLLDIFLLWIMRGNFTRYPFKLKYSIKEVKCHT